MNTSTKTPDPEVLRKIAEEFQLAPSRIPFHTLKPYHEFIVMLRTKRASYRSVAELLEKQGVKTSVALVAEYGRIILNGGKRRKRRKYAHATPTAIQTVPPATQPSPQISAPTSLQPVSKPERGPRIARIRMLDGTIAGEKSPGQTP
jgi:nitroreductase